MSVCCICVRSIVFVVEVGLAVSALVVALIASAQIELRAGYGEYFVGDGDDYEDVRESDRLQRLALIVGVSGYLAYIAVFIAASVGLVVHYKFSCKRIAWFFTSVMLLVSLVAVSMNIAALVFTVDATNKFNTVTPRVMIDSLRHEGVNVSLINVSGRSLRPVERDSTKSSVGVLWRELQSQRQCCGFGGVDDYVSGAWNSSMERHRPHAVAPSSCCSFGLSPCLSNGTDPAEYYAEGCFTVLSSSFADDHELVVLLSCVVISMVATSIVYVIVESRTDDVDDS